MKKSVSILASLVLVSGVTFATTASDEEPSKQVSAVERQTTHVSRDNTRPPLDDIVEAKRAMQKALKEARIAAEKKREEELAARAAAREAAEKRAAAERAEKARQEKRKRLENRTAPSRKKTYSAPSGNVKQFAASLVGPGQFGCLNSLWIRESNWNHLAQNPSSGAYGIPQSLPGSKMASVGSDWRTNPYTQVRWGVSYIKSRYGTPCNAWAHSQQVGWY
ncbi:transglycosylase [Streptomyces phage Muntaha]|uniref:Glycosyltransferase n=1 Tax=Streptomyces phage Muntaha TaxID=2713269 RepID=A0A6G8R318_9CAUD|nr:transglycosylase [Streptomyces phage Muntaha]QIN94571.1 glycosyltransferase [Streptomyces phage Muntaha]